METVVFYNAGKAARLAALDRIAPAEIEYPIVSKYVPYHTISVPVAGTRMEQEWLCGYDGRYDRK